MSDNKTLVIFYSFEGNTKLIAKAIAQEIGADLLELKPKNEVSTKSFMKYLWGGKQVFMRHAPDIFPLERNPSDYDILFIGTPVWAFSFTPALKTFFTQAKLQEKKIALFCCHGGGKMKALEKMKQALAGNEILGENDFVDPLTNSPEGSIAKAKRWAKGIIDTI